MPEKMERYIISLPPWLAREIEIYAKHIGQSFTGVVREFTRVGITKNKNDQGQNIQVKRVGKIITRRDK